MSNRKQLTCAYLVTLLGVLIATITTAYTTIRPLLFAQRRFRPNFNSGNFTATNQFGNFTGTFCIDWRLSRNWDEAKRRAAPLLAYCREQGLYVVESEISPFANVFPMKVDKGEAFRKLKEAMGVSGTIIYLGDSEVDDPAFQLAEISIGVKHRRIMPKLKCKYRIEFFEMENLLSKLLDADFDFQEDMVQRNEDA